ncbi:MAG: PAP2 family protein [Mesorhizobium sp.]|nr:MAG: PAP2 family protein [Mesorhizobium sp.]
MLIIVFHSDIHMESHMSDISASRYILSGLTAFSYVVVYSLASALGLKVENVLGVPEALLLVAAIVASASLLNRAPLFRAALENFLYGTLLVFPITIAVYLAARSNVPWADEELRQMDQALGINWPALIAFVDSRKNLSFVLNIAYRSFHFQLLILPFMLASTGHVLRSYQMTIAYAVICFVSCVISIWYPALGTYSVYHMDPSNLKYIDGKLATVFLDELIGIHSNSNFVFNFGRAEGIMTFPSVHAAIAALCAWAAWDAKWLRYPMLLLNILMAASAAIVSNHYVVDVIAGIGVAGFCISAVSFVTRPRRSAIGSRPQGLNALPVPSISDISA